MAVVIAAEPSLAVLVSGEQFDAALAAVATAVDIKSPYGWGTHRRWPISPWARASSSASPRANCEPCVERAWSTASAGWGCRTPLGPPGPLGAGSWERVRMHPYLTERMLHQSSALAPLGAIAVQLRERLDGSGYPSRLSGSAICRPARLLGAADPTGDARAAAPAESCRATRRPRSYALTSLPGSVTRRRSTRCSPRQATAYHAGAKGRPG